MIHIHEEAAHCLLFAHGDSPRVRKYLYGRVKFDSRESIFPTHVGGITRFTTQQLSGA